MDAHERLLDDFVFNDHRSGGPLADTDGKKSVGGASGSKQKTGVSQSLILRYIALGTCTSAWRSL